MSMNPVDRLYEHVDSLLQVVYVSGNEALEDRRSRNIIMNLANSYEFLSQYLDSGKFWEKIHVVNRMIRGRSSSEEVNLGFRITDTYVNRRTSFGNQKILATSPPEISTKFGKLMELVSDADIDSWKIPVIVFGGIFHIQPYPDGNKRTGLVYGNMVSFERKLPLLSLPSTNRTNLLLLETEDKIIANGIVPDSFSPLYELVKQPNTFL